jgi:hypothetical protein
MPHRCEQHLGLQSLVNTHTELLLFKSIVWRPDPFPTPLDVWIIRLTLSLRCTKDKLSLLSI